MRVALMVYIAILSGMLLAWAGARAHERVHGLFVRWRVRGRACVRAFICECVVRHCASSLLRV